MPFYQHVQKGERVIGFQMYNFNGCLDSPASIYVGTPLAPQKQKINLIGILVHRAFMICSKSKLDPELGKIPSILLENGYPEHTINSTFKRKLQQLNSNPVHPVKKCPVYLHIPWIGNVSKKFEKQITSAVKRCFFSVKPRAIFNTRQLLPANKKDVLPAMLFTRLCATAIVGTLVASLNA